VAQREEGRTREGAAVDAGVRTAAVAANIRVSAYESGIEENETQFATFDAALTGPMALNTPTAISRGRSSFDVGTEVGVSRGNLKGSRRSDFGIAVRGHLRRGVEKGM
jgi:hypothetical protein